MNNFLIGMYGKFDEEKFNRDFIDGFYGVEACMFPDESDVDKLVAKSREHNFHWGAHYPLITKKDSITRDPLFLSRDEAERNKAFNSFDEETGLVSDKGGKYILTHFPKPVLISDVFDFSCWRVANNAEWMYERDYPKDRLEIDLYDMFVRLEKIMNKHGIQVVLEQDAVSPYLAAGNILADLFEKFSCIKICLDIARLHLQSIADEGFSGFSFVEKFAKYAFNLHLWNTNKEANLTGGHLPVSPNQKSEDGFADIEKYLDIVFKQNLTTKILFEHKSELLLKQELYDCYAWVDSIQNKYYNEGQINC